VLTHIDYKNRPTMVDVSHKLETQRLAIARSQVQLPLIFKDYLVNNELVLKKGAVVQTAIIAGTMAVKKTSEFIPFCHALMVENCKFDIKIDDQLLMTIDCEVTVTGKTGVEMEALTGATVAALTVYDMCKALTHDIQIKETKLLMKLGGKHHVLDRPLYGLILTGGASKRMKSDKALINYHGKAHAEYLFDLLSPFCQQVFVSSKESQWDDSSLARLPMIVDNSQFQDAGPLTGILSAFAKYPEVNWVVLACDLVHVNHETIFHLLKNYRPDQEIIAYKNREKEFAEPLCTLYTPKSHQAFYEAYKDGIYCPVKILKKIQTVLLEQVGNINLANINTPEEREGILHA
jgi:cyclic pyranopterin monophosphate synthase